VRRGWLPAGVGGMLPRIVRPEPDSVDSVDEVWAEDSGPGLGLGLLKAPSRVGDMAAEAKGSSLMGDMRRAFRALLDMTPDAVRMRARCFSCSSCSCSARSRSTSCSSGKALLWSTEARLALSTPVPPRRVGGESPSSLISVVSVSEVSSSRSVDDSGSWGASRGVCDEGSVLLAEMRWNGGRMDDGWVAGGDAVSSPRDGAEGCDLGLMSACPLDRFRVRNSLQMGGQGRPGVEAHRTSCRRDRRRDDVGWCEAEQRPLAQQ
jgi:hypothetical protein